MVAESTAVRRLAAWQAFVYETEKAEAAAKEGVHLGVHLSATIARAVIEHHEQAMRDAYAALGRGDS
jgi:hypothetical protein